MAEYYFNGIPESEAFKSVKKRAQNEQILKLERRIEELEDKLLGCNRDRKEYRKQIDQLAKEKQDLAAQCARLRRKSREGK